MRSKKYLICSNTSINIVNKAMEIAAEIANNSVKNKVFKKTSKIQTGHKKNLLFCIFYCINDARLVVVTYNLHCFLFRLGVLRQ